MTFQEPTYEEYKTATAFAKFKYKWGIVVLVGCWIALVVLIIYLILYAKELATHPIVYTMDKFNLKECMCTGNDLSYYINESGIIIRDNLLYP